jgi:putative transposase
MGLEAIYRRPNTSKPAPGHKVYPYLLRGLEINRVNQVLAADITYIPMARGFLYLAAIMDWHSRYVLAWRLSNTLDADLCIEALEEALHKGTPESFNTDQSLPLACRRGGQFTSQAFTNVLLERGIQVSMDGKGRCMDNIFVESRLVGMGEREIRGRRLAIYRRGVPEGLSECARSQGRHRGLPASVQR